ncbi:hypothetical protein [Heyndrickxia acidiproducens]|uniref:hypothetical protein n=1 Tax=Heyndrickxia acidiproducens TaxID=1121084 RepID=UPI000364DD6A|nr:hypothetical protein [Heyndrickxia acidiproducens]
MPNEEFMSQINLFQKYGILKSVNLDKKVIDNGKSFTAGNLPKHRLSMVAGFGIDLIIRMKDMCLTIVKDTLGLFLKRKPDHE